jgi:hypothetical protein
MGLVAVINRATGFWTLNLLFILLFVAIPSSSMSGEHRESIKAFLFETGNSKRSYLIASERPAQ